MNIEVRFKQSVPGVSASWIRKLVAGTLRLEKTKRRLVSVLLTDNREIRRINRYFLKHDYATDVISFWCEEGKLFGKESEYLGDIVVSVGMARSFSRKLHIPFKEELARYVVHGVLHLLGYDDRTSRERAEMHRRQEHILSRVL